MKVTAYKGIKPLQYRYIFDSPKNGSFSDIKKWYFSCVKHRIRGGSNKYS